MFRNNTVVWTLYLICFVAAAVQFTGDTKPSTRTMTRRSDKRESRRRSRRSRSTRYRW